MAVHISMDNLIEYLPMLWDQLIWPLLRLLFFIAVGLLLAIFIESLNWTSKIAAVSRPLVRLGHFSEGVGAAFSMALVSGIAANTMLAESYDRGGLDKKELVLANLFNSLPTYFLHLPTIIVITIPLIKSAALIYISITFGAAVFRTVAIVLIGRLTLEKPDAAAELQVKTTSTPADQRIIDRVFKRFRRRMKKIVSFTVPIYIVIFIMNRLEFFAYLEEVASGYLVYVPWLSPQAIGIITLHLAAEITAGLAAAGALLQDGVLNHREVILALLVGNILSSPLRAIRHQFPYYAGIFKPKLALELIFINQGFRVLSLALAGIIYFYFSAGA